MNLTFLKGDCTPRAERPLAHPWRKPVMPNNGKFKVNHEQWLRAKAEADERRRKYAAEMD